MTSCVRTRVIQKENSSRTQHSLSSVLNSITQFGEYFTIALRPDHCSKFHEFNRKYTFLIPENSCHNFPLRLSLFWFIRARETKPQFYMVCDFISTNVQNLRFIILCPRIKWSDKTSRKYHFVFFVNTWHFCHPSCM